MSDLESPKEFRLKRGSTILSYIQRFSSTEKVIFGLLCIVAGVTALIMVLRINNQFLVSIPATGGDLREGVVGLPRYINPILAVSDVDRDISSLVYSGLMKYDHEDLVPDAATGYKVSDDGLTYTFTLRADAHFQDGTPLSADDVAYTIQKIQDSAVKSPRRNDWTNITVKVNSPSEIQFILKQPYAPFIYNTTIGILPKHIWSNISDDQFSYSQYNIQPIGAGPYKYDSMDHDQGGIPTKLRLQVSGDYYGSKPYLSRITFNFFADEEKALSALDDNTIDSLSGISPAEASALDGNKDASYEILSSPLPRIFGVFFNQNQVPMLADRVVRQALDMSIDRKAIVNSALSGYGVPIHDPLPPNFLGKTDSSSWTGDIAGAQKLLEKNGWTKGAAGVYQKTVKKNLTVLTFDMYTADSPDLKATAELLKSNWAKLGVAVNIRVYEPSDLYQNVIRPRKYDALLFGEFIGKDRDLYAFWHSSQRVAPGLNISQYTNTKVDKLLEDIRNTTDETARNTKYQQFVDLINADIPATFLFAPDFIYAVPRSIHGVSLGTITLPADRWNGVEKWYEKEQSVWKIFIKN